MASVALFETLRIPVYLSYSASSPATFPNPGTGTVSITYAPIVASPFTSGFNPPIPSFIDDSTAQPTFTISPCAVATFSARSGSPQSTTVNSAFSLPLQTLLLDINGNPAGNYSVTYTLPVNGAGALFAGGGNVATVSSNAQGIASSPVLIANGAMGNFTATATTGSLTASFSLTNLPGTSIINFAPIPNHVFGDAPFVLTATASPSTAPVSFSVLTGPAYVNGNLLTLTGAGSVTVQASQPAMGGYLAATASRTFNVAAPIVLSQNITFPPIPDHNSTDAPFPISATASSNLPVQFTVLSGPAAITGNIVKLTGTGLASILATQPGNATYLPAEPVSVNFRVFGPGPAVTLLQNGGFTSSVIAPDSFGEIFGSNLGSQTITPSSLPLPWQLGGLTLILTDAAGKSTPLLLSYVSPTQINFFVPAVVATGAATLVITNAAARTTTVSVSVAAVSPALFSSDGTGKGPVAGQALRVGDQIYLALYGTGFRNAKNISVTVGGAPGQILYRGSQGQFPGLDQLNLSVSAPGNIVLTADGILANVVSIAMPGFGPP
jgi:uncharacterized protein (TIGR03437 family)